MVLFCPAPQLFLGPGPLDQGLQSNFNFLSEGSGLPSSLSFLSCWEMLPWWPNYASCLNCINDSFDSISTFWPYLQIYSWEWFHSLTDSFFHCWPNLDHFIVNFGWGKEELFEAPSTHDFMGLIWRLMKTESWLGWLDALFQISPPSPTSTTENGKAKHCSNFSQSEGQLSDRVLAKNSET